MMSVAFMSMIIKAEHGELLLVAIGMQLRWIGRLQEGENMLQRKEHGCIIHVSDFVNDADGHLIVQDSEGNVTHDTQKIIYPGANDDAWWDNEQLLTQVKEAIQIFKLAHPNCICLFVFDQSSSHASLPPDTLKAFDMNKTDGGKQHRQ
jgi:hypothetical protein